MLKEFLSRLQTRKPGDTIGNVENQERSLAVHNRGRLVRSAGMRIPYACRYVLQPLPRTRKIRCAKSSPVFHPVFLYVLAALITHPIRLPSFFRFPLSLPIGTRLLPAPFLIGCEPHRRRARFGSSGEWSSERRDGRVSLVTNTARRHSQTQLAGRLRSSVRLHPAAHVPHSVPRRRTRTHGSSTSTDRLETRRSSGSGEISCYTGEKTRMREIVHLQAGQCGNQIGAKVSRYENLIIKVSLLLVQILIKEFL